MLYVISYLQFRRLRFSSDADIVRLTNARIIIITDETQSFCDRGIAVGKTLSS